MSHIQRPLTLPKHPELLREINEAIIGIKLHHLAAPSPEVVEAAIKHSDPTDEYLAELLTRCRNAINEQREDPRRY